jgi:hypothetical protein
MKALLVLLTFVTFPPAFGTESSVELCHRVLLGLDGRFDDVAKYLNTDSPSSTPLINALAELEQESDPVQLRFVVKRLLMKVDDEKLPQAIRNRIVNLLHAFLMQEQNVIREMKLEGILNDHTYARHWSAMYTGAMICSHIGYFLPMKSEVRRNKIKTFVDVGSGHGLPLLVLGLLFPDVTFTGFDIVRAKVQTTNKMAGRLGLPNVKFIEQDLSARKFQLPEADAYYFYNPVNLEIIQTLGKQLTKLAKQSATSPRVYLMGHSWTYDTFVNLGWEPCPVSDFITEFGFHK